MLQNENLRVIALLCAGIALTGTFASSCGGSDSPTEPPSAPPNMAIIHFASSSCNCVYGDIRLFIDGNRVGSMECRESRSFEVPPGRHSAQACDDRECWSRMSTYCSAGETVTVDLDCVVAGTSPTKPVPGP